MLERRTSIPVSEAVARVMKYAGEAQIEQVSINDCDGRYLGEDLVATDDVPNFDRSAFDGFAIRTEDIEGATSENPVILEVVEEIGAGDVPLKTVGLNQAVRIMTGAQMPVGATAVIPLELTETFIDQGKTKVKAKRFIEQGDYVTYRGQDMKAGTPIVEKGTYINPGVKALLATFGYHQVKVAKKPKVGVFATGSELLDVDEPLVPGKIRNSNAYMIISQIIRSGAEPVYFGKLADDLEASFAAITKALADVDILVTTGGVSVGDFDYLPIIYDRLGADVLFNKIAMRPGSVTTVAHWNGKILFGLSGNPSACYVGYELYARPIVKTLLCSKKPHLQRTKAILAEDFPKVNPFTRFVRSKIFYEDSQLYVAPSGADKSNIVSSLALCNSFIVLPGGTRGFAIGDIVDVLLLEDHDGAEWPWDQTK
ncbi:molybdopterin molybdenumtransferase [Ammoniphilus oxalaticus]|uniref:Molybdopterin molybdenumtransferase n=1 Tax=Ammoniphilus oxalaticus TaxID=66863 RepID=A0A419SEW2_9BACL|nr:gephyrin-like molybdotransferase Glp [Ammoniphilus oxalaticus]RKD21866.1 molybdopterin molybdenumtransferase [Ammoniphilus oxalaticus]